jgi:kumamolisin
MPAQRKELPGSERGLPEHPRVGDVDPGEESFVTVYLRAAPGSEGLGWVDQEAARPPAERRRLSRDELARVAGAGNADIEAVRRLAADHGLAVQDVDAAQRRLELHGPLSALAAAFGTDLGLHQAPDGTVYRARHGPLTVPADVAPAIAGVFGLDLRPQARPRFRYLAGVAATSYTPPQVAALYRFPTGVDVSGQAIGLIELGGGYRQSDIDSYFSGLGMATPRVSSVSVDGGTNSPSNPSGPDGEVALDIEVAGAVAPGVKIVVYFAPNTDQGFLDAVSAAVHDTANRPSVVSISWGGPESTWTTQAMNQMESTMAAAAAAGVTVCVAAGDSGSSDGVGDGQAHVDFPASAPHALGCGGTTLEGSGTSISSEVVWNDQPSGGATGGGVSAAFPVPPYQSAAHVPPSANPGGAPGRGVPDVAGDADPQTGYQVLVDGQSMVVGGTSAVAPLWSGLVALINASLGTQVGFLQPRIYGAAVAAGFHDITSGSNGAYSAGPGWDPCTGLGTPDGTALLGVL